MVHPRLEQICADLAAASITTTKSGPITLGGTTSTSGPAGSTMILNYTVDLTQIPPDALICTVVAEYLIQYTAPFWVEDPGGRVDNGSTIVWPPDKVRALNAAWLENGSRDPVFPVQARGSFTFPPPSGFFYINNFVVSWMEPNYP